MRVQFTEAELKEILRAHLAANGIELLDGKTFIWGLKEYRYQDAGVTLVVQGV